MQAIVIGRPLESRASSESFWTTFPGFVTTICGLILLGTAVGYASGDERRRGHFRKEAWSLVTGRKGR